MQAQFYGVKEPVMGNYEGHWTAKDGKKGLLSAQIRALGDGAYDGFVSLARSKQTIGVFHVNSGGSASSGFISFTGNSVTTKGSAELFPHIEAKGQIGNEKLSGTFTGDLGEGSFEAVRAVKKPESLGAKPPSDAVVIFDGKDTGHWEKFTWKLTDEGAMQVQNGDLRAKDKFTDFKLHLEFRTPFMPKARGQARGNSGVYLQRKYEVQVLDSFGLYPLQDDDCACIYKVKTAVLNACFPPMQWQTYDITYRQGNPANKETPTITVVQNGLTVIDNAQVPPDIAEKGTGGSEPSEGGFLKLQDHGNPVEYRNIWVQSLAK